ncbi:MAG: SCO family protein [Xanthobacteraceae bacterium]
MTLRSALLAVFLLFDAPAMASISTAVLNSVYVVPRPHAALPLRLSFRDDSGRSMPLADALDGHATVLVFADYTCRTLCGPILDFATTALQKTGLKPGTDYRLVVIGLNPRDGLAAARAMRASHLDGSGPIARSAVFLTGTAPTIAAATSALGYHFAYDRDINQYAHPAAVFVLTREGKLTRMLSGLGLSGQDMRLALVEAGQGEVGTLADRFRLLCYCYDPVLGLYTARINLILDIACAVTVLLLAAGILTMRRMTRAVR